MKKDIVILGGGPAGAASGILLAQKGLDVTIVEGMRFPRHRIGESLLPGSIPILNELGISSALMTEKFQPKFGARFYDPQDDRMEVFGFEPTPGSSSPAYQVWREAFDAMLLDKARSAGCRVLEGCRVERVDEASQRPSVQLADGKVLDCRILIDASGREAMIASKNRQKRMMADFGRVGIFNYFADLPPHDQNDADYITMYLFEGGWVWLIPLREGFTSVGVVFRKAPDVTVDGTGMSKQEAIFWHVVGSMPRLDRRLRAAKALQEWRVISDYSFSVERRFGPADAPTWVAVGDAGGFLDPIFSSGVHLALHSAQHASAGIVELLETGSSAGLQAYSAHMDRGFVAFREFVNRFYNRRLVKYLFFAEDKTADMHMAITRILAGHVWDTSNPVLKMIGANK